MQITIKNMESTISNLTELHQKNIKYATNMTINALAFDVQSDLNDALNKKLDIKTKKVGKAFLVKKSKSKHDLSALIHSKRDWHRDVIPHHFKGGVGGVIPLEHAQINRDNMSSGHSIIRGKKVKKLTKALANKVLHNTSRYFTIKTSDRSHLPAGVYERLKNGKLKRIITFAKLAQYNKILDINVIAQDTIQRKHVQRFRQSLERALLTSR